MDKKQTAQLLMTIKTMYKRWFDGSKEEFALMIEFWHEALKDMPYEMAKKALVDFSKNSQYPPTIADIYKYQKDYLEEQKALRIEYNNIYYTAIAYYPCYEDTPEVRNEFDRITGKSVSKATRLSNTIHDYVRGCEMNEEYIPPILEWLKGMKEID